MIQRWALMRTASTVAIALLTAGLAAAQPIEWQIVKPSNTGVPGEDVFFAKFDPAGNLWVAARWPFWGEGGFGILDLDTGVWTNISNWETPLPSEFINDVEFGPDGVVWIATGNGLARKDGDQWTIYNAANSPLILNNIRSIDLDSQGHVWINNSRTVDGALFEFDGTNWRRFQAGAELPFWEPPWNELSGLLVDSNDHVWVSAAFYGGVAEYDGTSWTLHGPTVSGDYAPIVEDLDGNIWLNSGVFFKFDGATFTEFNSTNTPFDNSGATTLTVDDVGRVWVANWSGQVIVSADGGASWSPFTDAPTSIWSIAPAPDGDIYLSSTGAVRHHDAGGAWIEAFNSFNTGLPFYFIDMIELGRGGVMLFADGEGGASRFDGARWRNWSGHNPNPTEPWPVLDDGANGVFDDSLGSFWIGTNGILRVDDETFDYWPIGLAFRYFAEDGNGTIWAAGGASLYRLVGGNWQLEFITSFIRGLKTDSAGNLWVAADFDLHKWDGQAWTHFDQLSDTFFNLGGLTTIELAPDDTVWLGSNEGLLRFDGNGLTIFDTTNSPLPAPEVQGIDFRSDGLMALSAHEFGPHTPFPSGVALIDGDINDPGNWSIYSHLNSPIPHWQLGDVEFDAAGNLWISAISEGVAVALIGAEDIPADLDGDGDVDLDDLTLLLQNFQGAGVPAPDGDIDGDGDTDLDDLTTLLQSFGA
jgi:ligand-binding sensor domain-containing protein